MTTCFERAKKVVDALIPVAEKLINDSTPVDVVVRKRLNALSGGYGWNLLNIGRSPIDYSKTTTHIAYIYRSFSAHADWVFKALNMASPAVTKALAADELKVACIGGGPGSDIAGVLKFAEAHGLLAKEFEFIVLDREPAWRRARNELIATYEGEAEATLSYQALDLADGSPWTDNWEFANSDLFVLSFALSEVWSFNKDRSVSQFLDRLITSARPGAIFCYVDNGGDKFTPLIEEEFDARDDLEIMGSRDDDRLLLSHDEQCSAIEEEYGERFKQRPKLTGNVALRVWKKL